jgi:YggT family protein
MLLEAVTRANVASYIEDLFDVYIALILIYILSNLLFSFGSRPPYSRVLDAILGFLRDVSEPFLGIFRRLIPSMGAIDLSPMLAILVLIVVRTILVDAIGG